MGYNPSIPQPNDFISQTQKQVLINYTEINRQYQFDHVPLTDSVDINRGKHKKVTFAEEAGDQTTGATDYAAYAKDDSGQPSLFGRPESDGTVYKWTSSGVVAPALRLEAFVIFDIEGNIIKNEENVELKSNVTTVVPASPLFSGKNVRDDWIVTFENNITTDKFFWVISPFYGALNSGFNFEDSAFDSTTPYMFGTYAQAVTASQIRIMTKTVSGLSTAAQRHTFLVHLQVYTVG